MPFVLAFKHYDPFDGERLPATYPPFLIGVSQRARILLTGRNQADLTAMAKELHRMMVTGYVGGIARGIERLNTLGESRGPVNEVDGLRAYFDKHDAKTTFQTRHGGQAEYFAVLALASIGEITNLEYEIPGILAEGVYSPIVLELADNATEAITHAETLLNALRVTGDQGRSIQKQKFAEIRDTCLALYDAKFTDAKSYGEAAFLVYLHLSDNLKSNFRSKTDKGREKTISRWIAEHRPRKSD